MTSLYTGYRNVYQPHFNIPQDNKEREEKVNEREVRDNKPSRVSSEEMAEDIDSFLEKWQKNRKTLLQNADQRQQMQDEFAKRKLALSNAIQLSKLASYEATNQQVQQEIKGLVQQLAKLLAAQAELDEAETKAVDVGQSKSVSAAVKKVMHKQQTMLSPFITTLAQETVPHTRSAPLAAEVVEQDATESETNPLLRSAPTETSESTTQAKSTGATTYADDITTIGQDKMTPEEQLWHDLSLLLVTLSSIKNIMDDINALYKGVSSSGKLNSEEQKKLDFIYKRLTSCMEYIKGKFDVYGSSIYLDVPEGMTSEEMNNLLTKAGIEFRVSEISGRMYLSGLQVYTLTSILIWLKDAVQSVESGEISRAISCLKLSSQYGTEYLYTTNLRQQIAAINSYYPEAAVPESDDSTLSGWLDGMLPAFDSIDKSNLNFYKSLVSLITSWQSKINDFNKLYSEILRKSGGVNPGDGKHRFDIADTDRLLTMLDDISALEQQMALVLGNVNSTDLQNLLEGTGINVTEVIGTVAMVDLGMDITNMMKEAVKGLQSNVSSDNYLVTPEQVTQFNSTLSQAQTQFDIIIKKVNTKAESAKSLFNDTKEALSNLLKTAETLLADLAKMIR